MPSQHKTHETCRVVHHLCPALHAPTISLASRQSHLSSHLPVTPLATRRLVVVGTPAGETSAPHHPIISSHSQPPPNAAARRRRVSTARPSHAATQRKPWPSDRLPRPTRAAHPGAQLSLASPCIPGGVLLFWFASSPFGSRKQRFGAEREPTVVSYLAKHPSNLSLLKPAGSE